MGISYKRLIAPLGLKAIRRSKNVKKVKFVISEVSLKDISRIIEEFKNVPYEGCARKRSKHMLTDSYFYLTRQLANFMVSNLRGLVRTQNMSTQNMSNSRGLVRTKNLSTQKMSNS